MTMVRQTVEKLLVDYIAVLESSIASTEFSTAREVYHERLDSAGSILARWRGGESEERLKAALQVELSGFRAAELPGREAESIGRTFGSVCRSLRVTA